MKRGVQGGVGVEEGQSGRSRPSSGNKQLSLRTPHKKVTIYSI